MKAIAKFPSLILAIASLTGCSPVLYSNVGQNVPLLQQKGEFTGQVAYVESTGAHSVAGFGLQGAYAATDKVGVITSLYSISDLGQAGDDWSGSGSYVELGGGLYGGKPEEKFLYEGYAGVGYGSIKNKSQVDYSEYINMKYIKPFVQPSIGFVTRYFDFALTPRIAYLSFISQDDYSLDTDTEPNSPREFLDDNNNTLVFEPGFLLRAGIPGVKLEIHYNHSSIKEPSGSYIVNNHEFFSIGLRFLIAERTSGKSNK
jgi:hypothetical protein